MPETENHVPVPLRYNSPSDQEEAVQPLIFCFVRLLCSASRLLAGKSASQGQSCDMRGFQPTCAGSHFLRCLTVLRYFICNAWIQLARKPGPTPKYIILCHFIQEAEKYCSPSARQLLSYRCYQQSPTTTSPPGS